MVALRFPLETERLVIRPLRLGHASIGDVVVKETGRPIGVCGMRRDRDEEVELVCRIARPFRRRGFGPEAAAACLRAAFHELDATRIVARPDIGDDAAPRMLANLGMAEDGSRFVLVRVGMEAADVLETLDALAGLRVWLDGGWGVEALLGEQARRHRDLDLALDARDLPQAEERLAALGYRPASDGFPGRPTRVVLADGRGRLLDLHPLAFDEAGDGWQELPDGGRGRYPAGELRDEGGRIAGRVVPCIGVELQLRFHAGYVPSPRDVEDVRRLRDRSDTLRVSDL